MGNLTPTSRLLVAEHRVSQPVVAALAMPQAVMPLQGAGWMKRAVEAEQAT